MRTKGGSALIKVQSIRKALRSRKTVKDLPLMMKNNKNLIDCDAQGEQNVYESLKK